MSPYRSKTVVMPLIACSVGLQIILAGIIRNQNVINALIPYKNGVFT